MTRRSLLLLAKSGGVCALGVVAALAALAWYEPKWEPYRRPARQDFSHLAPSPMRFVDATSRAGIRFRYNNGAFGLKWFPENMGGGAAFFDYDGDGDPDLYLVNGRDWTDAEVEAYRRGTFREHSSKYGMTIPRRRRERTTGALYRNNGNGTFTDVTQQAGLDIEMYGLGAAAGDYDNDGRCDLFVTAYGRNYLFHNQSQRGRARFREVAGSSGVRSADLNTSAAFLDYDRDGRLDLFVGHYAKWHPQIDIWDSLVGKRKSYKGPNGYVPDYSHLFRNVGTSPSGETKFSNVSFRAGIHHALAPRTSSTRPVSVSITGSASLKAQRRELMSKALGVATCDYNNDGWPDIVVANDGQPNFLFRNNGDGTFAEVGVTAGVAYSTTGRARSGMGIDTIDVNLSGRESILIGNYSTEMLGLYHNKGRGLFSDIAGVTAVGPSSYKFLTFGCVFADINNDGWPDILTANGHVLDDIERISRDTTYKQRAQVFLNLKSREMPRFLEIGLRAGRDLQRGLVGRGLACADVDLDGDIDVLLCDNIGSPLLLLNEGDNGNGAIRLSLQGFRSNRSAIGATVEARVGRDVLRRQVRSGSSYLSQSELPLTLGLGRASRADSIVIRWPSGKVTRLRGVSANSSLTVHEDRGIVSQKPLRNAHSFTPQRALP